MGTGKKRRKENLTRNQLTYIEFSSTVLIGHPVCLISFLDDAICPTKTPSWRRGGVFVLNDRLLHKCVFCGIVGIY